MVCGFGYSFELIAVLCLGGGGFGEASSMRNAFKGVVTRFRRLRKTLLLSSLLTLLLPVLLFGAVYAAFNSYMYALEKANAYKITNHFKTLVSVRSLDRETPIPEDEGLNQFTSFAASFSLYKIKIFSATGMVIYSTRPSEMGERNSRDYFWDVVAKGQVFQKRVVKDSLSAQGIQVSKNVIETYIPIMDNGEFLGAAEVYTDISGTVAHMRRILVLVLVAAVLLGASLLCIIVFVDRRAARAELLLLYNRLRYEHSNAVSELQHSEKRFHLLFQNATMGMAKVLPSGEIVNCNDAFCHILGRLRKQVVNLDLRQLVSEDDAPGVQACLQQAPTAGKTQQLTARCDCPDSRIQWVEFSVSPLVGEDDAGNTLLVSCRDVTTTKMTDEVYSFLAHSSSASGKDFFASLASYLSDLLRMEVVSISKVTPAEVAHTLVIHQDGQYKSNISYNLKGTPCEGVTERSTCCHPSRVREVFPANTLLRHLQAESYAGTPLWDAEGKPIGIIACMGRKPIGSPDLVKHVLRLVSLRASGELERLLSEEVRERNSCVHESLASLACAFLDANNLTRMAEAALAQALAVTGSCTGLVGYLAAEGGQFVCAAKTDDLGEACVDVDQEEGASLRSGVWLWALREKKPLLTNNPTYVYRSDAHSTPPRAMKRFLSVPAMAGDALVGQIALANAERDYDDMDLKALESIATIFSLGVRRLMLENELVVAKEGADRANMAKSYFLAAMSHEIRTPLNGVLGMLQLLQASALGESQRRYVDMAALSSRRLTRLLSDIIDLSKIESERLDLHEAVFSVSDLQETVANIFSNAAMEKGIVLEFDIDAAMPSSMVGDALRVRQILINLVGNAIKFTDKGRVAVMMEMLNASEGGYKVRFTVSDTGVGIPGGRLNEIFEPFTQVDCSYERRYQGAGLGLAITRRLVDIMHGDISIESSEDMGTVISVNLPFRRPAEGVVGDKAVEGLDMPRSCVSLRVLLAEDDAVSQLVVTQLLEGMGHEVVAVPDGEAALKQLARSGFDLLVLDLQMPVMDGLEATRRIRKSTLIGDKAQVPIIALTGHALANDREKCTEEGMDGFVVKPVELEALAQAIAEVLDKRTAALKAVPSAASYTDRQ